MPHPSVWIVYATCACFFVLVLFVGVLSYETMQEQKLFRALLKCRSTYHILEPTTQRRCDSIEDEYRFRRRAETINAIEAAEEK